MIFFNPSHVVYWLRWSRILILAESEISSTCDADNYCFIVSLVVVNKFTLDGCVNGLILQEIIGIIVVVFKYRFLLQPFCRKGLLQIDVNDTSSVVARSQFILVADCFAISNAMLCHLPPPRWLSFVWWNLERDRCHWMDKQREVRWLHTRHTCNKVQNNRDLNHLR